MTQPWLKVYPERMLGDAKLNHLSSAEHWWLIVCLHIAANAEPYGELRLPSGRVYTAATLARFMREPVKKVAAFLDLVVDTGIAEQAPDGGLCFPNLARLQGQADATATLRKRRQRDRSDEPGQYRDTERDSHGDVTPSDRDIERDTAVTASRVRASERAQTRAEAEAESRLTQDQPETPTPSRRTGHLPDLHQIKAQDIADDTRYEIERLLTHLGDKDQGTPGRLVALARRGATARHFADARQGITTTTTNGSPSRKACQIIENALSGDITL